MGGINGHPPPFTFVGAIGRMRTFHGAFGIPGADGDMERRRQEASGPVATFATAVRTVEESGARRN